MAGTAAGKSPGSLDNTVSKEEHKVLENRTKQGFAKMREEFSKI